MSRKYGFHVVPKGQVTLVNREMITFLTHWTHAYSLLFDLFVYWWSFSVVWRSARSQVADR